MKKIYLLLLVASAYISCKTDEQNYYPPKGDEQSEGTYNKYKLLLDTAYMNNNDFEVAIQLANLKGDKTTIFEELDRGIKADTSNCQRIYDWARIFHEANFQTNLVKTDTTRFLQSVELCKQVLAKGSYQRSLDDYQRRVERHQASKTVLDSTKFDLALIAQLEQMIKDDQGPREEMSRKNITKEEIEKLWIVQKKLDSINLHKVDKILSEYGYPTKEQVGHDLAGTVLLVLHHQSDLQVRYKYLPVLKKAVEEGKLGKGGLNMFQRRNKNIEIDQDIRS